MGVLEEMTSPSAVVATGFSWRRLFFLGTIGAGLVIIIASIYLFRSRDHDPTFAGMIALFFVGGLLSLGSGKAGVTGIVLASIAAVMFIAVGGEFAVEVIRVPEAASQFIPVLSALSLSVVTLISAVVLAVKGKGRGHEASGGAKALGALLALILVVIGGYSSYATKFPI